MDLDKAIQTRKSVERFTNKKPDWRDIIECIDAVRFAPMAGNNFTLKFIITQDPTKIQRIADASQQPFIAQAQILIAVCSNKKRTINAYEKRGEIYVRQQAGAAIQNFLLKLEEKKLATCWVGHFVDSMIKEVLKIPDDIQLEAVFPIGYECPGPKKTRHKIELDRFLYFEKYNQKKMKMPKTLDI